MARDRDNNIDDHSDVTSPVRPRRVEVLRGPERRRRWPDAVKIGIVAEALGKDVVISDVARRHDISPSQLFGWMQRFRTAAVASMADDTPTFAPAVIDARPVASVTETCPPAESAPSIEICIGASTVRIRGAVDMRTLTAVLKTLKVLA